VEAEFIFGLDHNTLGILVVVILSLEVQEAPYVNKDSTPVTIFFLFFMEAIQLLVTQAIKYCSHHLDTLDTDGRYNFLM
jgi:hypothetical protein